MRIKLKYNQRTNQCYRCSQSIAKAEPVVIVWFRTGDGSKILHQRCFEELVQSWFDRHEFIPETRKSKCPPELRKERRQLLSKMIYHRKRGHDVETKLLQEEMSNLEW